MVAETKLMRPRLPQDLIDDPERLAMLDRSGDVPLTLICAPAGYGKTTLVSHWLERRQPVHAWLALESRDNQPEQFWRGVRGALGRIDQRFDNRPGTLIQALEQRPADEPVDRLINALGDYSRTWQAPQRLYLILDDFHLICEPAILLQVRRLLELAPGLLRLVLVARAEPALRVAQLIARNQVLRIDSEQLRFDLSMSQRFLQRRLRGSVSAGDVRRLHDRTGGWPAALQLASLVPTRCAAAGGDPASDQRLSDYLLEEVYGQLSPSLQAFLLDMALLPFFSIALADAVRLADDSARLIAGVNQHGLLLQHLGGEGQWFRLHDLLRDWLLQQPMDADRKRLLRLRAADALADGGRISDALELYLAEQCYQRAEALLPAWLEADILPAHRDLPQRFPLEQRQRSPALAVVEALFCFLDGHYEDALTCLDRGDRLRAACTLSADPVLAQVSLMLRCPCVRLTGREDQAQDLVRRLEQTLDARASGLQLWALHTLGANAFMDSELELAERYLQRGLAGSLDTGDSLCAVRCLVVLIPCLVHRAEVTRAWSCLQTSRDRLATLPVGYDEDAMMAYLHGLLHLESNNLVNARQQLDRAFAVGDDRITPMDRLYLLFTRFRLELVEGREEECLLLVSQIASLHAFRGGPWTYNIPRPEALRALVAWRRGDASGLVQWSLSPVDPDARTRFCQLHESVLRLAGGLLLGQPLGDEFAQLREDARQGDNQLVLGRLQVMEAVNLWYRDNDQVAAVARLSATLDSYVPRGNLRLFLDEGVMLEPLLKACLAQNRAPASSRTLLAQLGVGEEGPRQESAASEDISEREREVLLLLASGLTNRALSERLGISQATIKSHLSNIYGKLGVGNRTGAVARARALGITR